MSVGQLQIGAGIDQCAQGFLVPHPAVAQHHGFNRSRPVQVVDKVQRRTGSNQLFEHPCMPQVRSCNQRRAVVAAGPLS